MPPRVYRKRTSSDEELKVARSGSARLPAISPFAQASSSVGFTQAPIASSGSSPLAGIPPIPQDIPRAKRGAGIARVPSNRRSAEIIDTRDMISRGLIPPHGRLPPIGGRTGDKLQKIQDAMANMETRSPIALPPTPSGRGGAFLAPIQSSQSAPANIKVEPDLTRRAGSLPPINSAPTYSKGGSVKKTGMAKVHKGEVVIPKARVEAVEKAVKKAGLKSIKVPVK